MMFHQARSEERRAGEQKQYYPSSPHQRQVGREAEKGGEEGGRKEEREVGRE